MTLDISVGIGWASEKLLLLCFKKKAQNPIVEAEGPCLLETLPSGVFANVLKFLFVPFRHEVQCEGSIFAGTLDSPLSMGNKRAAGSDYSESRTAKKRRYAL